MLSLIEVTCPHCAAHGQIMLPPLGSIIIGPCPECQGTVAIFCGRVLALDTEIMTNGANDQKRSHVGAVLGDFLRKRVERLFSDIADDESSDDVRISHEAEQHKADDPDQSMALEFEDTPAEISTAELESFVNVDLRLLDNADYFRAIFDRE